jgi:hypothetical protein
VNPGRREGGSATISALVLLTLALLIIAGVRVFGHALGDKLRCHGDAVAAIGSSGGGGSRCADSAGREASAVPPETPTSAPSRVRPPADPVTADQWLSRFVRAVRDGFTEEAHTLAELAGSAWEYGTTPSRWGDSGARLREAAVRDVEFLLTDPLGALWTGVVTDARIARDMWLGLGQWMVDTGAALLSGNAERMGRSVGELGFDGLTAFVTEGAGLALRPAVKATVIAIGPRGLAAVRRLRFAQTTASAAFSADGTFAGETIESLAAKLRAGTISPADVPVRYVTIEGNDLIDDTRSALALRRAGIPQSSWTLVDATATDTAAIEARLIKNGLTAEGTDVLRITGAGPAASSFR